jgi:hypothetical protein
MERAEAVKRYLYEQHQVPLHKINVISYGEDKPVAPNNTQDGRAQNRRVWSRPLVDRVEGLLQGAPVTGAPFFVLPARVAPVAATMHLPNQLANGSHEWLVVCLLRGAHRCGVARSGESDTSAPATLAWHCGRCVVCCRRSRRSIPQRVDSAWRTGRRVLDAEPSW